MKIQVEGKSVLELNETKKKVIKNNIPDEIFQEDMERRVHYAIHHKYEQCFKRLKEEWDQKLKDRVDSVPTDPDKYAELVFAQKDYLSRSQREKEAKKEEHLQRTGQK